MSSKNSKITTAVSLFKTSQIGEIERENFDFFFIGNPYCIQTLDNPVGSIDNLKRAFEAMGDDLSKTVVSLPVTPIESEIPFIEEILSLADSEGTLGVEVQSPGMAMKVHKEFPKLKIYFGSFAVVYTDLCALEMKRLGCVGGTLPAELSLDEIEVIGANSEMEIFLPVYGKQPIAVSRYCYFHPDAADWPFECSHRCEKGTLVDYGEGLIVDHRGRLIITHKTLNMLEHLPALPDRGLNRFRVEGCYLDAEVINQVGSFLKYFSQKPEDSAGYYSGILESLKKSAVPGFCNGFFFSKRGLDYVPGPLGKETAHG